MDDEPKLDLFALAREASRRPLSPEQAALRDAMLADEEMLKGTLEAQADLAAGRYHLFDRVSPKRDHPD